MGDHEIVNTENYWELLERPRSDEKKQIAELQVLLCIPYSALISACT